MKIPKQTIETIDIASLADHVADPDIASKLQEYLRYPRDVRSPSSDFDWKTVTTFFPPRMVAAYKEDCLCCFFGSGISVPCGLPSWNQLLSEYFSIDANLLSDESLKYDPLTLAEIASHNIGNDRLQNIIRDSMSKGSKPSTNHGLLARLRLPYYITTNYDALFEKAWDEVNQGDRELVVVVTSDELAQIDLSETSERSYLFKIHGSVGQRYRNNSLILTRSDYRHHYRSNFEFFTQVKKIIRECHILFLGFSHQDPEVNKLVEDVIFDFEERSLRGDVKDDENVNLYSLQFDMRLHTPEIFGARGIVAISPPDVSYSIKDISDSRSLALGQALVDIMKISTSNYIKEYSIDCEVRGIKNGIDREIESVMSLLKSTETIALESITGPARTDAIWFDELLRALGDHANQGLFLVNGEGAVVYARFPEGLDSNSRQSISNFGARPYFRLAKTFGKPLVSDSYKSIYNENSTIFFCVPLTKDGKFRGLIFSACQIGGWKFLNGLFQDLLEKHRKSSVLLVDSNGVCLLPSRLVEMQPIDAEWYIGSRKVSEKGKNWGYNYEQLLSISRRDKLVSRIRENVIPITQDDDILSLAPDLKYYSVITNIGKTRWKLAVSTPIALGQADI